MPTSKRHLTESAGNKAIGGVPHLHYFDIRSRGRGQVLRLFWEDAGIAYDDTRYTFTEYREHKWSTIADLSPTAQVPLVELNGQVLTQSYPMLRHFARQLGKYDGETEEAKYWVDSLCDMVIDWRTLFVKAYFGPQKAETYPKHQQTDRNRYLKGVEGHLNSHEISKEGPFIVGTEITYADIVLYQICHDEDLTQDGRLGLKEYPRLTKLVDAVEDRPNIKSFMQSDRYLG